MPGTIRILALMAALLVTSGAWAQNPSRVVAVNYPLQYFAERLLGERAEVSFPVPAETDPSFWRPAIADISSIQSADLILLNGASFATWIDRVSLPRSRVVNTSAAIKGRFIATESVTHSHGEGGEHSHEGIASYTWLDPSMALAQAEAIAGAITRRKLATEAEVAENLEALRADMETLEKDSLTAIGDAGGLVIIATHPRYQYLARAYGLKIVSLDWEAGEMPNDAQLAALAQLAERENASILLWEAEPPMAARDAVKSLGLTSVTFQPLAHRPTDGDFLTALRASLSALASAIAGARND